MHLDLDVDQTKRDTLEFRMWRRFFLLKKVKIGGWWGLSVVCSLC